MSVRSAASSTVRAHGQFWDYSPAWIRTGDWLIHPRENQLSRGEQRIALEPRLMDLLLYFVTHAGEVLSTEVLLEAIWGGTFYSDNPVHRSIALLRRALGDAANAPSYLLTVRKRGYQWIGSLVFPDQAPVLVGESWNARCPFPGARPFDSSFAAVFFGRQQATTELLKIVHRQLSAKHQLLLLSGASGVGKTSLVQAALIPTLLATGELAPGAVSVADGRAIASTDALERLCLALCQWRPRSHALFEPTEAVGLAELASSDFDAFCSRVQRRLSHAGWMAPRESGAAELLLLVIDQIEAPRQREGQDRLALVDRVLHWLATAAPVLVMLVARSDDAVELGHVLPACTALAQDGGSYCLASASAAEIAAMIRGPARLAGLSFERDASSQVRLDDVLTNAVAEQPASVPLLQALLVTLYAARAATGLLRLSDYRAMDGLDGHVVQTLERTASAVPNLDSALDAVLRRMVRLDLTNATVDACWLPWSELSADEIPLLNNWLAQRLVVSDWVVPDGGVVPAACFRPAHTALLQRWPRAQHWCTQHMRFLRAHARLRQAAKIWQASGQRVDLLLAAGRSLTEAGALLGPRAWPISQTEIDFLDASRAAARRQRQLRRNRLLGLAAMLLLSAMAGLFALDQRRDAAALRESAQSTVDYLVDELAERIRAQGNLELLREIGQRAMAFPSDPQPRSQDAALRHAKALRLSGEVAVGQGDTPAALRALTQAQSRLDPFARSSPSSEVALELGAIHYWLGYIDYRREALEAAQRHWRRYFELAEGLVARDPRNSVWQMELSYAINNLGALARERRQWPAALAYFSRSERIKTALQQRAPDDVAIAADLADTRSWLAAVLESSGKLTEALDQYRAQVALLERVGQAEGPGIEWQFRLALARTHAARVALDLGQIDVASGDFQRASGSFRALVKHDPSNQLWRYNLAFTQLHLGWLAAFTGGDAQTHYRASLAQWAAVSPDTQKAAIWQRLYALLLLRRDETPSSTLTADDLIASVRVLRALHAGAPQDFSTRLALAQALNRQAERHAEAGHIDAGRPIWVEVVALLADPGFDQDPNAMSLMARAAWGLGDTPTAARMAQSLQDIGYQHPEFLRWSATHSAGRFPSVQQEVPGQTNSSALRK